MGTGLDTTVKYVRQTASGAACSCLDITIEYLRQTTTAGNRLATTNDYLRGAEVIGLGTKIKCRANCL
jgi:hypothetical protein